MIVKVIIFLSFLAPFSHHFFTDFHHFFRIIFYIDFSLNFNRFLTPKCPPEPGSLRPWRVFFVTWFPDRPRKHPLGAFGVPPGRHRPPFWWPVASLLAVLITIWFPCASLLPLFGCKKFQNDSQKPPRTKSVKKTNLRKTKRWKTATGMQNNGKNGPWIKYIQKSE